MSRRVAPDTVAVYVLALCALAVTGMMAWREFGSHTGEPPVATPVRDWQSYAVTGDRLGPPSAPVTIIEFSDFQCPYCKALFSILRDVRAAHPVDVSLVYRHFPLTMLHAFAFPAAVAAECASRQHRFEEYHDLVFLHQDSLASMNWTAMAARAGVLDTSLFRACIAGPEAARRIRADSADGARLGVRGTPTVLINGWRMRGAPTANAIGELIDSELKRLRK